MKINFAHTQSDRQPDGLAGLLPEYGADADADADDHASAYTYISCGPGLNMPRGRSNFFLLHFWPTRGEAAFCPLTD